MRNFKHSQQFAQSLGMAGMQHSLLRSMGRPIYEENSPFILEISFRGFQSLDLSANSRFLSIVSLQMRERNLVGTRRTIKPPPRYFVTRFKRSKFGIRHYLAGITIF